MLTFPLFNLTLGGPVLCSCPSLSLLGVCGRLCGDGYPWQFSCLSISKLWGKSCTQGSGTWKVSVWLKYILEELNCIVTWARMTLILCLHYHHCSFFAAQLYGHAAPKLGKASSTQLWGWCTQKSWYDRWYHRYTSNAWSNSWSWCWGLGSLSKIHACLMSDAMTWQMQMLWRNELEAHLTFCYYDYFNIIKNIYFPLFNKVVHKAIYIAKYCKSVNSSLSPKSSHSKKMCRGNSRNNYRKRHNAGMKRNNYLCSC